MRDVFFRLLVKADGGVASHALHCLLSFKEKFLVPYKARLLRLVNDATYRHELVVFDITRDGGVVQTDHRAGLLPVLVRLLYGRLLQRRGHSARDTPATRRATILGYFSGFESEELGVFMQLLLRAFTVEMVPPLQEVTPRTIEELVNRLSMDCVTSGRAVGFLKVQRDVIRVLGTKAMGWMHLFMAANLRLLRHAGIAEQGSHGGSKGSGASTGVVLGKAVRREAMLRVAESLRKLPRFGYLPWLDVLFKYCRGTVQHLAASATNAVAPPALLLLVQEVSAHAELVPQLAQRNELVAQVLRCLTAGLVPVETEEGSGGTHKSKVLYEGTGPGPRVIESVLAILSSLLQSDDATDPIAKSMQHHVPLLLQQFCIRLSARRRGAGASAGLMRKELAILLRVARHAVASQRSDAEQARIAQQLFQLLLPYLKSAHKARGEVKEEVLNILRELVPLQADPFQHLWFLCHRVGPGKEAMTDRAVRTAVVSVVAAFKGHAQGGWFAATADALVEMNAFNEQTVDEYDYDRRMATYEEVVSDKFVAALLQPAASSGHTVQDRVVTSRVLPLLHQYVWHLRVVMVSGNPLTPARLWWYSVGACMTCRTARLPSELLPNTRVTCW